MKRFIFIFTFLIQACWAFGQDSPLKTTLYFPQFADGGGWSSTIELTNLLQTYSAQVQIQFFDDNGNPLAISTDKGAAGVSPLTVNIPAGGVVSVKTAGTSTQLLSGWTQVSANVRVGGRLVYAFQGLQTTVLASPTWRTFTIPVNLNRPGGVLQHSVGIAFANPNSSSSYVDLTLVDANGVTVPGIGNPKRITLQPMGHLSAYFHESALLGSLLGTATTFQGTINVTAQSNIVITSLGSTVLPGTVIFDNAPPLPGKYLTPAEVENMAVQVVYFVPKDVTADASYNQGLTFMASETMHFYDMEFARAGQQSLSALIDYARDNTGKIRVDMVHGLQNLAYYDNTSGIPGQDIWTLVTTELAQFYGSNVRMLICVATNADGEGFGSEGYALVTGPWPATPIFGRFSDYSESFLEAPFDKTVPNQLVRYDHVTWLTSTSAHEMGHSLSLFHSDPGTDLSAAYPGVFANLMSGVSIDGLPMGFEFGLMPDATNPSHDKSVNVGLESSEIMQILSYLFSLDPSL